MMALSAEATEWLTKLERCTNVFSSHRKVMSGAVAGTDDVTRRRQEMPKVVEFHRFGHWTDS